MKEQLVSPIATLTVFAACAACAPERDGPRRVDSTTIESATGTVEGDRQLFVGGDDWNRLECVNVGRLIGSTSAVRQRVMWDRDRREVVVINTYRSPEERWEPVRYAYATEYDVMSVDGRQPDELIVVGRTDERSDVIERWTIAKPQASHDFGAEPPSTPNVTKEAMYRGSAFGEAIDISVDPEGRFAIVLDQGKRALYRVSLREQASPEVLLTNAQVPFLANARSIYRMQHREQGRVYILEGNPTSTGTFFQCMLFDIDNDGTFEAARTLSDEEFAARGYRGDVWVSDFLTFGPPAEGVGKR